MNVSSWWYSIGSDLQDGFDICFVLVPFSGYKTIVTAIEFDLILFLCKWKPLCLGPFLFLKCNLFTSPCHCPWQLSGTLQIDLWITTQVLWRIFIPFVEAAHVKNKVTVSGCWPAPNVLLSTSGLLLPTCMLGFEWFVHPKKQRSCGGSSLTCCSFLSCSLLGLDAQRFCPALPPHPGQGAVSGQGCAMAD